MAIGKNARPDETVMIVERGCFFSNGSTDTVKRMGASRFVSMIASASVRSAGVLFRFSAFMMPALLMSTLREGKSSAI
jgi:hypothetical protein